MIFLDSANLDEIKEVYSWKILKGITTNQKIFLKSGVKNYEETIKAIVELTPHLSVELTNTDKDDQSLLNEAISLHDLGKNIVIKIPMWGSGRGLRIANLVRKEGIPVNMTCLMGSTQAILTLEAEVEYLSLFYNRMADYLKSRSYAQDQISIVRNLIDELELDTKIIAGSIRDPKDVIECLTAGAHIVTVPYQHFKVLPYHQKTESTIMEFDDAWAEYQARAREK